ncbi:MAG: alanine racemase [Terracidiphilus sp.]
MNRTIPTRPCWVEIRAQALEDNFRFLKKLAEPHAEVLAVLKANAYGHSLAICAPALVRAGANWLGVNSVEEGAAARAACPADAEPGLHIDSHTGGHVEPHGDPHILVIGGVFAGQGEAVIRHGLTPVIWEPWQLDELETAARAAGIQAGSLPVHLEIDTGMSRQGVSPENVGLILARITPGSPFRFEGIMTHLFAADEADGRVTAEQLARLDETLNRIEFAGQFAEWLNVGNSATLLSGQARDLAEMAARHGMKAMLRPGLALYGVVPRYVSGFRPDFEAAEPEGLPAAREALRPVLEWKSQVVGVRHVEAGAVVGYNGTFVATEPMRLALVAIGYADGFDRKLGNRFSLLVRGKRAPVVGRVSMDQTVIDVTEIAGVEAGDEVVIIGSQGGSQDGSQGAERITAFDHADASETIPWEVFTRIGARVERRAV